MINPEVRHIIEAELTEGEELLWAEKPARHFDPAIVFGFLISGCVLMFIVPDTLPEIVKGWKTLSYGVVSMSFILLLALLWGLRAICF